MKHASQSDFGRRETIVLASVDKWELLSALTAASADFDISHRTLTVLKALLTFLPDRKIPSEPGRAVVFPSNRKLSERLNGMPESTMRRHLARLVSLGLVNRRDSPNRKRYARRVGQGVELSFGFDLYPLTGHAEQIFLVAHEAALRAERMQALRDRIALARQDLIAIDDPRFQEIIETARLTLRRKASEQGLLDLAADLEAVTADAARPVEKASLATTKLSAPDSQNERHIQDSIDTVFDSEKTDANDKVQAKESDLETLLAHCTEYQAFFPKQVTNWREAIAVAEKLSPMIGIEAPVFNEARVRMGATQAATVVLCILERLQDIRSPGAYLRKLAQKAQSGSFSCVPMLRALENRGKQGNCQLTI